MTATTEPRSLFDTLTEEQREHYLGGKRDQQVTLTLYPANITLLDDLATMTGQDRERVVMTALSEYATQFLPPGVFEVLDAYADIHGERAAMDIIFEEMHGHEGK